MQGSFGKCGSMSRLILGLYSGLMRLAQPLLRRKMTKRAMQEPGYAEAVDERFGRYTHPVETTSELVWLHAVSLGETRTAAILLKALRVQYPALRILLTHGTATGRTEGKALLQPGDVQVWQAWDTHVVVGRFFEHFKPRLGLLMETEVWPCTVFSAKAHGMPLALINGRLSEKTLQQALTLSPLAYPAYGALTAVYAQTAADARRYRRLGVEVAGVFGNIKFDAAPSPSLLAKGKAWRQALLQPVVMFASSREGEEDLFLKEIKAVAIQIQVQKAPDLIAPKYLIVPRHPQRFGEVAALIEQHGLTLSRRSSWSGSPSESQEATHADIWLGDSLGEMPLYYALSDVALLGGSFKKLGGQNLIEAAACGCAVVMGPHTFNFSEAAALAETAGAALRVEDMHAALQAVSNFFSQPLLQQAAASSGLAFAASNCGATALTLAALQPFLNARSSRAVDA
jgi:3-deoxy-D-manno-octulosonic-acid transferase